MAVKGMGYIPDLRDERDVAFSAPELQAVGLPAVYSMLDQMPPVYNQGAIGSCTAQALAGALQYTEKELVNWEKRPVPARLFLYYNARQLHNTVKSDSGASIRNSVKAAARWGYCAEKQTLGTLYAVRNYADMPTPAAYRAAAKHRLADIHYARVGNVKTGRALPDEVKAAIAANNPVDFGFTVYENWQRETGKTGITPMPKKGEDVSGGHAVLAVGYDDARQSLLCRNSYGVRWGNEGYFWMSYDFMYEYARDFWVIKLVPTPELEAP